MALGLLASTLAVFNLAGIAAASLAHDRVAASPEEQEWAFAAFGNDIGRAGFAVADLDGNGTLEVVATSRADKPPYQYYISVYEATTLGYEISRFSSPIDGYVTSLAVFDSDENGEVEIYIGIDDQIEIRDPWTLKVTETLTAPNVFVVKIMLADCDNDGSLEIIACNSYNETWIYDAKTREFEQSIPYSGRDLEIGDVDGDTAVEMVFASYDSGVIVQLESGIPTLEWTIPDSADGMLVELGNIDHDPQLEIFLVSDRAVATMKVYNFGAATHLWQIDYSVGALVVRDVSGDPVPEVLYAERWDVDGYVRCLDAVTGIEMWSIPKAHPGIVDLLVADTDNDAELEVFWSSSRIVVHSVVSQAQEWSSGPSIDGPFRAVATGDADNDGELEILFASMTSAHQNENGTVFMFDASNHNLEWRTDENTFPSTRWDGLRDVAVGDVDNDGLNEVVVVGRAPNGGAIFVFQDTTATPAASYVFNGFGVMNAVAIGDVDNDGTTEIVTASDGMVHVIDGTTGVMEWSSPSPAPFSFQIQHLAVGNLDLDPALEIVAARSELVNRLYVFDGVTHETWSSTGSSYRGLDLFNFDADPRLEIITGSGTDLVVLKDAGDGSISEFDRITASTEGVFSVSGYRDIDGNIVLAFAQLDETVSAMRVVDETIVWSAGPFGNSAGLLNNLESTEIPTDSGVLILIGSAFSVHQLGGPQGGIFSDGFESGTTSAWN